MFRTDDNYNLYFDGVVSQEQETNFKTLIMQHQIANEFAALLKKDYNFNISNTYGDHRKLIWILYQTLGPFAISAIFAEKVHPPGCEYEARVDFYVEGNGSFEYELKNNLFLYDDYGSSDECKERITRNSIGFDKNCRIRGNIKRMDLTDFVKKITGE
jgi:hypothetical protein